MSAERKLLNDILFYYWLFNRPKNLLYFIHPLFSLILLDANFSSVCPSPLSALKKRARNLWAKQPRATMIKPPTTSPSDNRRKYNRIYCAKHNGPFYVVFLFSVWDKVLETLGWYLVISVAGDASSGNERADTITLRTCTTFM